MCIDMYVLVGDRSSDSNRNTPATLVSALVVSTPETTRGLYTLPSWKPFGFHQKPSATPTRLSPSGKIEILRVVADAGSRFRSEKKEKERREGGEKYREREGIPTPARPRRTREKIGGFSVWSLYGDTHARHCGDFLFY